jgi:hypothetical protein
VDRTRQETTSHITTLAEKFDAFAQSNEHRLTVVETHQASQAKQLTEIITRIDRHGERIGAVEGHQRALQRTKRDKSNMWTKRNMWIVTITSIIMAAGTITTFAFMP